MASPIEKSPLDIERPPAYAPGYDQNGHFIGGEAVYHTYSADRTDEREGAAAAVDIGNKESPERRQARTLDLTCVICLDDEFKSATTTSCGHTFCADCILECASNTPSSSGRLKCPVCRDNVTMLIPNFVLRSMGASLDVRDAVVSDSCAQNDTDSIDQRIRAFNDVAAQRVRPLLSAETLREDSTHLRRGIRTSPFVAIIVFFDVVVTLLYLFNALPFELVDDSRGFGYTDEFFWVVLAFALLFVIARRVRGNLLRNIRLLRR